MIIHLMSKEREVLHKLISDELDRWPADFSHLNHVSRSDIEKRLKRLRRILISLERGAS